MKRKSLISALTLLLLLLTFLACQERTPQQSLEEFYTYGGAEDELMDPLILAGRNIVPLVIEKVKDKKMPRRMYAIGFLGNGRYDEALPVLESILPDETDIMRGSALVSIFQIDENLGRKYAQKFSSQDNEIGDFSRKLLGRKLPHLFERRSYYEALVGMHE